MPSTELGWLELQAGTAVLSEAESINGDELGFARKAMGLRQPDSAALLVTSPRGPAPRWETGAEPISAADAARRAALPRAHGRHGEPVPLVAKNDNVRARCVSWPLEGRERGGCWLMMGPPNHAGPGVRSAVLRVLAPSALMRSGGSSIVRARPAEYGSRSSVSRTRETPCID
jgi:hypothetical protein